MKKILLLAAVVLLAAACKEDNPDKNNSIFDTNSPERNSFDTWLLNNYTIPYNIRLLYKMRDIETDYNYNVIPATLQKSKEMAWIIKYMWLEPYEVVAKDGVHFVRSTVPPIFHFIGSPQYTSAGTIILGVAEGGAKITVAEVNNLDKDKFMEQRVLNTIHHEFAHILHQTQPYNVEFQKISAADYISSNWQNRSEEDTAKMGFVSPYAGSAPDEDFVEIISRYVTWTDAQWEAKLTQGGAEGRAILMQKFDIVASYMRTTWGVELDELRQEVQNRAADLKLFDMNEIIDF